MPPQLMVVIDTEEEFDWSQPVKREHTSVAHMEMLELVQSIFNEYNIVPCYVVDYPIVTQDAGTRLLKHFHGLGQCEIGAHLHPWVSPPLTEEMSAANTYPGNLSREFEYQKIKLLKATIDQCFEQTTHIYKAGRYGFGNQTEQILVELGFDIDVSVCPPFDYRSDGGPDYRQFTDRPFWSAQRKLLEIPVTGGFVGWAGTKSAEVFDTCQRLKYLRAPAIASRLGLVDRLLLSPEGFTSDEHKRLTKSLIARGSRVFTWSFHSSSIVPGHTVYVKNQYQLQQFLDRFRRYFDFFFNELHGHATTPTLFKQQLETQQ
jgi:hypothetical protein